MMSNVSVDLFTCPAADVTFDAVASFVATAVAERLQAESLVVEFKRQNDDRNVAKAVAAMANTEGGIVIIGVDEALDDPIVGVSTSRHDAIVNSLRARLPEAMPEVIPIAIPQADDILLLLLRIDPESAVHPVVLDGKVYKRIPGNSVGARRDEIVALSNRPTALSTSTLGSPAGALLDMRIWGDEPDAVAAADFRARARFVLPRRLEHRGYLGSAVIVAVEDTLRGSPVPELVLAQDLVGQERRTSSWERTDTAALLVDFAPAPSTRGPRWRPAVDARLRVFLRGRVLEVSAAIRLAPKPHGPHPVIGEVAGVYDVLLAACWTVAAVGHACTFALGADPTLQAPSFDAAIAGAFSAGSLRLGTGATVHDSSRTQRSNWPFPARVPTATDVAALGALVKEWLHVPLFEFGMVDFEEDLTALEAPRWAGEGGVGHQSP